MTTPTEYALTNDGGDDVAATSRSSVCVVILTYNRIPLLERCLAMVRNQTRQPECVLVVDNHSSDETPQYLAQAAQDNPLLRVLRTDDNLGPAGGFAEGIKWAVAEGHDYLWLLDDDTAPEPSCLELQLEEIDSRQDVVIYPRNVDEKNKTANYPAWRGPLIPREVVNQGGVPNKDLFWSKEDTEYFQWRLPRIYGVKVSRSEKAVAKFNRANSMTQARPAWKYYYWGRNTVYYRVWVQRPWKLWRFRKLVFTMAKLFLRIIFWEDQKIAKSKYLFVGVWHGIRGRLGKTVDPATS